MKMPGEHQNPMSFEYDFFDSNTAKNSPNRVGLYDYDLIVNEAAVNSPISMPVADITINNNREMDYVTMNPSYDFLLSSYERAKDELKIEQEPKPRRSSKKLPAILRPFSSIEATEQSVQYLRSTLAVNRFLPRANKQ